MPEPPTPRRRRRSIGVAVGGGVRAAIWRGRWRTADDQLHLHRVPLVRDEVDRRLVPGEAGAGGCARLERVHAHHELAAMWRRHYNSENGYVITWLLSDAGNRRPPRTPLIQPVSPPLCKMTGASTCTPFTAPVRWMRNLTVTRPGT